MYNSDMIIYGEILFIENMIIGGVLLYLTSDICGQNRQRIFGSGRHVDKLRFAAGSIICGLFSLVIFLGAKAPLMMLMEAVFAVAVCTIVFNCPYKRTYFKSFPAKVLVTIQWQKAAIFILVTYSMGGIVMGILLVTRQQGIHTAVGIYTGDMKAAALALFICVGYITVKQIIKTVRNKKLFTEYTYEAEIVIGEHIIKASAFLDTGNRLKDPLTGKPVAVASKEFWERSVRETIQKTTQQAERFVLVPYEAVGTRGMLKAIRTDHIEVAGRKTVGCILARSERDIKIGMDPNLRSKCTENGYDLLISGEMV